MNQIQQIEVAIKEAKELVERRRMAQKLHDNPEFKKLVLEDFMVQDVARNARLSTEPGLKPEMRADALAAAQAPGYLMRFLSSVIQMGNMAEDSMKEAEKLADELRAEEAQD